MPGSATSSRPFVIGLAGGSGSGKSTVMERILSEVGHGHVAVLDHDAYYRDLSHLTFEQRCDENFDHPDALETELLCGHLDALRRGETVRKPVYDFTTHSRTSETTAVSPRPVILVEGILVLSDPELVRRFDLRIFVHADDDVRLMRRIRRDIVERGRAVETVLDQYETTVRPMYLEYVEPSIRNADMIVPKGGHNAPAVAVIAGYLGSLIAH